MLIEVTSHSEGKRKVLINTDYIVSAIRKEKGEYVETYDRGKSFIKYSEQLDNDATVLVMHDGSSFIIKETLEDILNET